MFQVYNRRRGGRNISLIEDHHRDGSKLVPPLARIGKMTFYSWRDEALPDTLWAVLISAALPRERSLDLFRSVFNYAGNNRDNFAGYFVSHPYLAKLTAAQFDELFREVVSDAEAVVALSCLFLFDALPDRDHWLRHIERPSGDSSDHWQRLSQGVADCFDHQSQLATDIRWLRLMFLVAVGRFHVPPERLMEFVEYPHRGDMRSVRPSIRAAEMATRNPEFRETLVSEAESSWPLDFWNECWNKTGCAPARLKGEEPREADKLFQELVAIYKGALDHFYKTIETTDIDPRHDSSFGLLIYAIDRTILSMQTGLHTTADGRFTLRCLVELFITLKYLYQKDDPTIWLQHRNYGSGQAKLSFLKNLAAEEVPSFVDLTELESYANEDMWQEFQAVDLGSWARLNLRSMAQEVDEKQVYDKYYDWTSGYAHGQWTALRDSCFATCMNPLHRYHRVAVSPRHDMPSILPDACGLLNRMLDILNSLYPSFSPRVSEHKNL